jgi:hypothetical protein
MQFHFELGEFVEYKNCPGAVFRVVKRYREYDGYPMVKVKFVGPRKGIPTVTKGRLHKHFRIKTFASHLGDLTAANPMLVIAVAAGG